MNRRDRAELASLQTKIAHGQIAMRKRNALLMRLFNEGATQAELAEIINESNRQLGEPDVTPSAIHRAVKRLRIKLEGDK